ncbi:cryptochrome [Seminavis robusta]|uniref:Cryptochrome n=1 Tax=Seminavis robusta TaxID=568900 RepID=A0A9N8HJX9_9STRA|nr:cryptochrome [Seminavis robusta]|eukprot:Sro580_g170090.1 cryptochrome (194) ;mRNA; r:11847-12428
MANAWKLREVVWTELPGSYERQQSEQMKLNFLGLASTMEIMRIRTVASYTLYHPEDLPRSQETWSKLARPNNQTEKSRNRRCNSNNNDNPQSITTTNLSAPDTGRNNNPPVLSTVDCSPSRWMGLPRIMGGFRRAARTAAPVRPCLPPPCWETIHPFSLAANSNRAGDLPSSLAHTKEHHCLDCLLLVVSLIP